MSFVATALEDGLVNVSPKGRASLRVTGPNTVLWRNLAGNGNETGAHLRRSDRITLMWCAFEGRPLILRACGIAAVTHKGEPGWHHLDALFEPGPGATQILEVAVDLVETSCGFAVPLMDFPGGRDVLRQWSETKGEAGVAACWQDRNRRSIDSFDTEMPG